MDVATARLVTSPQALSLLASMPEYDASQSLPLGQALRDQGADPGLVAAVMSQSQWRQRAQAKFGDFATGMLFTSDGLEQATRLPIAALHAQRFRDAGLETIADLTCGIGADAMAASALGLGVMAFEKDEATALIADYNLRHWKDTVVVNADSIATVPSADVHGIFADPARRTARGRRHNPADYSPSLESVMALRTQFPALGVKVGPGIAHDDIPAQVEAQWVSVDGAVVEAALWCGPLSRASGHSALVIRGDSSHELRGITDQAPTGALGNYIIEPDGAVIRSGLIGQLAADLDAHLIDPTIAYLTADAPLTSPFVTQYRVEEVVPYSVKNVAAALRSRGIGRVDIKKRGIDVTPEKLRPLLKLKGDGHATVILTRIAGKHHAMVVEPVPAA